MTSKERKKMEMKFSEWLRKHYKVKIRDLDNYKIPNEFKAFKRIGGMALFGKLVLIRNWREIPETFLVGILLHEAACHIRRQRKLFWWLWKWRYLKSKKFRRKEEVLAYTYSMEWRYINGDKNKFMIEEYATLLRDMYFLDDHQYNKARFKFYKNWGKIERGKFNRVRKLKAKYAKSGI